MQAATFLGPEMQLHGAVGPTEADPTVSGRRNGSGARRGDTEMNERIMGLFIWMAAVYGRTWSGQYAGETAKVAIAAWGDGLYDLTDEHLEAGKRATLKRHGDWPPSLPEYRRLCLGLGSDADAVEAAMNRARDHPIGRYIAGGITSWDWSNLSTKDLEKRCRGGLEDARRRAEEDAIENPPLLMRTTKAIAREAT